jgi:adenylate cyclase
MGLLKSKLSRRIVAWVFLSIIAIEFAIFVPAFFRRRDDKLKELEALSQEVLFSIKSNLNSTMTPQAILSAGQTRLKPGSVIIGATLYDPQGNRLGSFGDPPTLSFASTQQGRIARKLINQGKHYDVAWPASSFNNRFVVAIRHDSSAVGRYMVQYAVGIGCLVTLISAFVTVCTVLVLERIVINPLLYLREDLLNAAEALKQSQIPQFRSKMINQRDELGDVAQAFSNMFQRIQQEIDERKAAEIALRSEQEKSEQLLLNILPASIATRLKDNQTNQGAIASRFENVTILFADIVGFTQLATRLSPTDLVCQLNTIFSAFDKIAQKWGLEKIKTIGDAYMVVGGVPEPIANHAETIMLMALDMLTEINRFCHIDGHCYHLRIGIHTGPVVAGVIGIQKFSYDLWGDTVNVASRMESQGVVDRIQVSEATYLQLKERFTFEDRGEIEIKGRGPMQTYLLKA